MDLKTDIDTEKWGWISGGIVALASIIRTYILRTKPAPGTMSEERDAHNVTRDLEFKQQEAMFDRYKRELDECDRARAEHARELARLQAREASLSADVRVLKAENRDLREEIRNLRGGD